MDSVRQRRNSEMDSPKLDHEHRAPLLNDDDDRESDDIELAELTDPHDGASDGYPKPPTGASQKSTSYLAIAGALTITVVGFTINTEATAYFEDVLGWKKPFCTMYITHGSLWLPWICHLAYSRYRHRDIFFKDWKEDYLHQLRESIATIDSYSRNKSKYTFKRRGQPGGPIEFLCITMAIVTVVLTISGCSWFLSLAMTTPADLTAIYNCSTFFAAVFSVPILKERMGWMSIIAVALSIAGTFVIAYGDTTAEHEESKIGNSRLIGNLVAFLGAVAFGLYEVVFKKWACSSRPLSPSKSLPLTFAASALTGFFTLATLWIGLIALHFTGVERFELPGLYVSLWIVIGVLSGSISINLLVVLVIWTNPVFGSMTNVLSVVAVAFADWVFFNLRPSIATYVGGAVVVVAFALLSKDSLGEKERH